VERDVLVRSSVAPYLRKCGYAVIEALSVDEALQVLKKFADLISVVLTDVNRGFLLSQGAKQNQPHLSVVLTGTVERAADAAAELCEDGPQKKRPHDPQLVVEEIRRALARRTMSD